MERLLFAYAGVGLATGAAALALLALAPFWETRYAARFRCIVWLALAVRLLVPFAAPLPAAAPQPLLLELPAGKLDEGEDHRVAAARELSEETGLEAGELTYLGCILASPGFCTEKLHMYLARDLSRAQSHPDDDEFLNVVTMPFEELFQKVMDGTLEDAKTVATVLKTKVLLNL